MELWRICRAKYAGEAFTGHGAERTGGRWNLKGSPMIYASENLSLAVLELFVHLSPGVLPPDLVAIRGVLPDSVSITAIASAELPKNWRNYPAPAQLQTIGNRWLQSQTSLALIVPSAINPLENNILLNPAHPEMTKLKTYPAQPFQFDPRMFGK